MRSKVGIVTIYDNENIGNRLQNYAVQQILISKGFKPYTIKNCRYLNNKENKYKMILKYIKYNLRKILKNKQESGQKCRNKAFYQFNKNIRKTFLLNSMLFKHKKYKYFICGSDQVWNSNFERMSDFDLLTFTEDSKKIAYACSFGTNSVSDNFKDKARCELKKFKALSVRENVGKTIINELTDRTDVEVLIDPTMMLSENEWDKVAKKPSMLKSEKYILLYFLGEISGKKKLEINNFAVENQCEIIDILDKNSPYYNCGPSEFLYLEKNAFLICTDSFHSCVFAILYKNPFLVFEREGIKVNINSRIDTLLTKFKLENKKINNIITKQNMISDYENVYNILEKEREKANKFLENALDIK